ncbi:MAG: DUF986 family protein [Peptoniphilaceae bacterium]|nr:DUF986 family protein [Peptoniphilaceae bacterium]MDY6019050.1 DUF986 family protein [Anaerococcus sp.]
MSKSSNLDKFIIILYVVMIGFLAYRIYKSTKEKKNLEGEITTFAKRVSTMEYILFAMLIATGGFNLYNGLKENIQYNQITGGVMIVMAIVFFFVTKEKLYIGENGLMMTGKFYSYKEIKKFGFDPDRGDFVILVKSKGQESRHAAQVNKNNIETINTLMRKYKLGK